MTASQDRIKATSEWTDIVAGNSSLASVDVLIQNQSHEALEVVYGGMSTPSGRGALRMKTGEVYTGNAANIWVRGDGYLSATVA